VSAGCDHRGNDTGAMSSNRFAVLAESRSSKKSKKSKKSKRSRRKSSDADDTAGGDFSAMFAADATTNWADCEDDDDFFMTGAPAPAPAKRDRTQSAATVEVRRCVRAGRLIAIQAWGGLCFFALASHTDRDTVGVCRVR